MKTMVHRVVPELALVIVMHAQASPSAEDWSEMVRTMGRLAPSGRMRTLVFTDGASPNSAQRAELADALHDIAVPIAVVTDSIIARGAVTAFRWLGQRRMRSFSTDEQRAALEHLGVPYNARPRIYELVWALRQELVEYVWDRTSSAGV